MGLDVQAEITSEEGWKRQLRVTVPATEVDGALGEATRKLRKEAKIPGFRPGKVPLSLIKERYGSEIKQEALESLLRRAYEAALDQLKLIPIGSPNLSKVKFEPSEDMAFDIEIEIRPTIEIKDYKGLKLEKKVYEITDKDVELAIDSLREKAATTTEVSRPAQDGDIVVCDLQKIRDSLNKVKKDKFENITFDLREDRTRPEFLKGIIGMTIGEGREIEVAYSEEEHDPDLSGNTVLFRAWLKKVSQKSLPAADDEFAKSIGKFESADQMREYIRGDLQRRTEMSSLEEMGQQARQLVIDANPFDVPQGLLDEYIDGVAKRLKEANPEVTTEAIRAQFEPAAIEQFRWDYIVWEIAKNEGLSVTDEEVKEVLATWPPSSPDKPSENKIHESLLENRVYEFLATSAVVEEVPRVLNPQIVKP